MKYFHVSDCEWLVDVLRNVPIQVRLLICSIGSACPFLAAFLFVDREYLHCKEIAIDCAACTIGVTIKRAIFSHLRFGQRYRSSGENCSCEYMIESGVKPESSSSGVYPRLGLFTRQLSNLMSVIKGSIYWSIN